MVSSANSGPPVARVIERRILDWRMAADPETALWIVGFHVGSAAEGHPLCLLVGTTPWDAGSLP